jgi:DNA-binding XRE family transcriptional regulator
MEFRVEFYESASGACPVRDFLDELSESDPDDFAAVLAGLDKPHRGGARDSQQGAVDCQPGARSSASPDEGMEREMAAVSKSSFDRYLDEQLRDPGFAARFKRAGEAWDVALQIAALRERAGLSQKELARQLGTSQQHVSRLESPGYEGHSLASLRRVAEVLDAQVRVVFEPRKAAKRAAEPAARYRIKARSK